MKRFEIEATEKRLTAEANLKRLEMESAEKSFVAEKEKEERETRLIAEEKEKDREANFKRLELQSQERIWLKELELRLSLERRPGERSLVIGQGDESRQLWKDQRYPNADI